MKKLSDFKGSAAVDLGEQILDFAVDIFTDEDVIKAFGATRIEFIRVVVKNHKKELTALLEALDPDEELDALNMMERLAVIINELSDSDAIMTFFGWQSQTEISGSSGSVTESIKAKEK